MTETNHGSGPAATLTRLEGLVAAQAETVGTLLDTMAELEDRVAQERRERLRVESMLVELAERLDAEDARQQAIIVTHARAIRALQSTAAGAVPEPTPPDASTLIIGFLDQHPGVKLNPMSIAENIGVSNKLVADRCARLALAGKITRHAQEGRVPLYSSKKVHQ